MAKSNTTTSYRFDDDFLKLLDTWSFVSGKDKGTLLQEAFGDYVKLEQNASTAEKVKTVMDIMAKD